MTAFLRLIDRMPLPTLLMMSALLGFAPFVPEPHIVEKIRWLFEGHPFKAIDVFDVFWHSWPLVFLAVKLARLNKAPV